MGGFTDPYNDFGRLSSELWRAVRLVLDTGLHAKGWTEDEAVAWAMANSARPESSIKSEVKRFLLNPAQATTYKIGMIAIQKLRDEAKAELGDKFDWKSFHDTVITGGSHAAARAGDARAGLDRHARRKPEERTMRLTVLPPACWPLLRACSPTAPAAPTAEEIAKDKRGADCVVRCEV